MAEKTKYPRAAALAVAKEIHQHLAPLCEYCKVAGSLRRHKAFVSDIEILFVPRFREEADGLFDKRQVSLAHRELEVLIKNRLIEKRQNINGSEMWGEQNMLGRHVASGIPVDFFSTTEAKWWNALVIRTGGKRMNLALTMSANARGLTLHAYGEGFTDRKTGEKIPTHSEQEVFSIAGVDYREPQYRP